MKHTSQVYKLAILMLSVCSLYGSANAIISENHDANNIVYVIANPSGPNTVAAFKQDPLSGRLAYVNSFSTGGRGSASVDVVGTEQSALVVNKHRLYAVNPGSNDISVFAIDRNGSLELIGDPISSGGVGPISIALHDHLLYVANLGDETTPANYTGFRVDDNHLSPIEGSTVTLGIGDHPSDLVFSEDGDLLVGSRAIAGIVDVFRIGEEGIPVRTAELANQPGVIGLAFDPVRDNQLLGALTFLPGVASYSLSPRGAITVINSVVDPASIDSCWIAVNKLGTKAWFSAPASTSITLYSIDRNGILTRISAHSTISFGDSSTDIVLDASELFMFSLKPLSNRLHVLSLTEATSDGGLFDIGAVDIPGSEFSAIGLVVVALRK